MAHMTRMTRWLDSHDSLARWLAVCQDPKPGVGEGGGDSQKNWVGVCGPLPKTLTLFMTKICDKVAHTQP